ncbi:MAG: EF-hand domain-containing protein [Gemmataceae bacterium]|nr:EF-hand domain-containing protein [Gemmataceae bacterium]MDW8264637.1 EF-hand domain-containing protein [Gemmataceae bacterium]
MNWLNVLAVAGWLPVASAAPPADDTVNLVFFAPDRPIFLRLQVLINDRPFVAAWTAHMARLFDYLDTDADGVLSRPELRRSPEPDALRRQMNFGPTTLFLGGRVWMDEMVGDKSIGEVTFEDFAKFYRPTVAGPIQIAVTSDNAAMGEKLDEALFRLLDADGDGKVTETEAARAFVSLKKADLDDDDLIGVSEVVPGYLANSGRGAGAMMFANPYGPPTEESESPFFVAAGSSVPERFARQLLRRYDRNRDGKLSPEEAALGDVAFARADADGDGILNDREMPRLLDGPSDLECAIRFSSAPDANVRVTATGGPLAKGSDHRDNGLVVRVGPSVLTLVPRDRTTRPNTSIRQLLLEQFRVGDTQKRGFVTREDLSKQQFRTQQLLIQFALADRNGDGQMTLTELNEYIDLQTGLASCFVAIQFSSRAQGLFDILDAERDGRLTQRELLHVWSRLAAYRGTETSGVRRSDIPRQFGVSVGWGSVPIDPFGVGPGGLNIRPIVPAPLTPRGAADAPLWFRKMDRNSDGDLSPREFLGTAEDFRRLDTDGDGLISAEEAKKGDRAARKP